MGYEDHRQNKDCFRGLNTKYHFACKIWFENEDYNLIMHELMAKLAKIFEIEILLAKKSINTENNSVYCMNIHVTNRTLKQHKLKIFDSKRKINEYCCRK